MNIQLSRNLFLLCLSVLILSFAGCKKEKDGKKDKEKTQDSEEVVKVDTIDKKLIKDVKAVKEMFYSMPSPLEVAMILKQAGKDYNTEILNPTKHTSKYVTNKSMALNLGVYTTDLSYSSLYDQTQTTIDYINAAKDMAEGLGMLHAIDEKTIDRLEANVNNRDVILDIISETIMNSSSFFKENDRQAISTIVLIGGWVEGLYIATKLVGDTPTQNEIDDSELIARIADQKLALNTIIKLMEKNKDDKNIQAVMTQVKNLQKIYDKIEITSSKVVPVTDEETNVTTLKSETTISMTPEIYKELKKKIEVIRKNFTS